MNTEILFNLSSSRNITDSLKRSVATEEDKDILFCSIDKVGHVILFNLSSSRNITDSLKSFGASEKDKDILVCSIDKVCLELRATEKDKYILVYSIDKVGHEH
jgi:tRNA threonylcarbamoyladenosine modification (KEOPS) complex Cgi121 subunit